MSDEKAREFCSAVGGVFVTDVTIGSEAFTTMVRPEGWNRKEKTLRGRSAYELLITCQENAYFVFSPNSFKELKNSVIEDKKRHDRDCATFREIKEDLEKDLKYSHKYGDLMNSQLIAYAYVLQCIRRNRILRTLCRFYKIPLMIDDKGIAHNG